MRRSFTQFSPNAHTLPPPTKLRRAAELLARRLGEATALREEVARDAALAWLVRARASNGSAELVTRQLARGLASLYVRPPADSVLGFKDEVLAHIARHVDAFHFSALWALWQLGSPSLEAVGACLARLIAVRTQSPRLAKRLPLWAPGLDYERPLPGLRSWVEARDLDLVAISPASLRLSLSGGLGEALVLSLVREGSANWWSRQEPAAVRAWASQRAIPVRQAVADRQLVALGGDATSVADLPRSDEAKAIKTWVMKELGDPQQLPGSWRTMSPRALEIFEWLVLWDELALIFAEFARSAEDDRARFWKDYLPRVRDARYYKASTTAVCMLAFDDVLVIEFGNTGNAAYIYRRPRTPLRRLKLGRDLPPNAFKSKFTLSLGDQQCAFLDKLSHNGDWQWRFSSWLTQFGLRRQTETIAWSGSLALQRQCQQIQEEIFRLVAPRDMHSLSSLREAIARNTAPSEATSVDLVTQKAVIDLVIQRLESEKLVVRTWRNGEWVIYRTFKAVR